MEKCIAKTAEIGADMKSDTPRYLLKDVAIIIAGQSPDSKYYNTKGEGLPFFQGKADFGVLYPKIRTYCSQPTKIAEKDDILLSVRAPVGPTNLSPGKVCIGRGLTAIRPSSRICLKYLLYFFRYYEVQLQKSGTGTTFKAITQNVIKNIEVPVPDLYEQERIVSKIEELFSGLDASVAELQTAKEKLKVYRQAVLKEAFDKVTNYPQMAIQDICDSIVDCPHSTPKWTEVGKICLRTTNFKRGYLDLTTVNYVSEETFAVRNSRLIPLPGDILYSREGAILGIACIIPSGLSVCLGQRMMLLRTNQDNSNYFLMHYLNSPAVTNFVAGITGGSASPHINVRDIKNFLIHVPDLNTQKNIVLEIEQKLSICDDAIKSIDFAICQAEALRQSILKQAFEGEL